MTVRYEARRRRQSFVRPWWSVLASLIYPHLIHLQHQCSGVQLELEHRDKDHSQENHSHYLMEVLRQKLRQAGRKRNKYIQDPHGRQARHGLARECKQHRCFKRLSSDHVLGMCRLPRIHFRLPDSARVYARLVLFVPPILSKATGRFSSFFQLVILLKHPGGKWL